MLMLRGPRDGVVPKKHRITRGGSAGVQAPDQHRCRQLNQVWGSGGALKKPIADNILKVSDDPLNRAQVRFPGIVHVGTNLLDPYAMSGLMEVRY